MIVLSLYKLLCFALLLSFLSPLFYCAFSSCADLHYCSGHGKCTNDDICICDEGWGSASDLSLYKSPDCSTRVCPSGIAWADLPTTKGLAHNFAECSNGGLCNRKTGKCECFKNYAGEACQRSKCPNNCSGHGVCKSMRRIAQEYSVNTTIYGSGLELLFEDRVRQNLTAWDADSIFGCVCDSSWVVGPYPYQVNEPEWFGPDCSKRHCPRGDNPYTPVNELDCAYVVSPYTQVPGFFYNICQVDCANLGICDYSTGVCDCFPGQYGPACNYSDGLQPNATWPPILPNNDDS